MIPAIIADLFAQAYYDNRHWVEWVESDEYEIDEDEAESFDSASEFERKRLEILKGGGD